MSWVTVLFSMIASSSLTLGVIYAVVWYRNRTAWAHLLFSVSAISTAVFAFFELWMMRAETPAELLLATKWAQVPIYTWLLSILWFVRTYLGAGRLWLAWTITGVRTIYLLIGMFLVPHILYRELAIGHVQFLGESVTVARGVASPWYVMGNASAILLLVFLADATITAWRRGDRHKAVMVGGSAELFLLMTFTSAPVVWGLLAVPFVLSLPYMAMIAVMGYEVSRDVLRASQLVHELQVSEAGLRESEERMSLAVAVADFGIWIRDLRRKNEIWASEKWRELFGFTSREPLEFDTILKRLHPEDRAHFEQAVANAVAGANGGRYQTECRLMLPDGTTRWIHSKGHVERDATGRPVLIRGASRDITARKRDEMVVRTLSGRLLSAQEEERRRIAGELHDNVSQQLALLSIEIEQLALMSDPVSVVAERTWQLVARTAEISKEIHSLSHRLHSAKLEALGLEAAVHGHCRELRSEGLQVQCVAENVPGELPYDVALCLFRILQEGLKNVVKHSGAREARVTLTGQRDVLVLTIADSGQGFDERVASVRGGLGLASMRERVLLVGGEVTFESHPGDGATIITRVPILGVPEASTLAHAVSRDGYDAMLAEHPS